MLRNFGSYLKELLAKEGFLVISVPYNVTFDHANAVNQVYERFNSCLDYVLSTGLPDANLTPDDLVNLPIYSVGHRSVSHFSYSRLGSLLKRCIVVGKHIF